MNNQFSNYRIERYLNGYLSAAEKTTFEEEMDKDPELAQRVGEQKGVAFNKTFNEIFIA